jgi:hypothetical protein
MWLLRGNVARGGEIERILTEMVLRTFPMILEFFRNLFRLFLY